MHYLVTWLWSRRVGVGDPRGPQMQTEGKVRVPGLRPPPTRIADASQHGVRV